MTWAGGVGVGRNRRITCLLEPANAKVSPSEAGCGLAEAVAEGLGDGLAEGAMLGDGLAAGADWRGSGSVDPELPPQPVKVAAVPIVAPSASATALFKIPTFARAAVGRPKGSST